MGLRGFSRQQPLRPARSPDRHAHADADDHTDAHRDTDNNSYMGCLNTDLYADGDTDDNADTHRDTDGDTDGYACPWLVVRRSDNGVLR